MAWTFTEDLDAYLAAAGAAVAARPVDNTLLLTVAGTLRRRGSDAYGEGTPRYGWWRGASGRVDGALLWTPPHAVLVGTVPAEAVAPLAEACLGLGGPAVSAERGTARALAARWRRAGAEVTTVLEQRLYRLGEPAPPDPAPPGRARVAAVADRELLVEWVDGFRREAGHPRPGAGRAVDDRLAYGGLTLWEDDGVPVSMAGVSRPAAGTVRVAPVYTPPRWRRRGYAAAVTSAVSLDARSAGAGEVLLFTDLANPTSNGVYRRIGYRPVADRVEIAPVR
ncbi:GNAT family N-acetyltransferase [Streptomyces agglomeratus]|uniref:GNAT family N-acetyltransferase n=1 Tax=Streptomyces agglomeratus TaxID=285458 RepID=A0A1E5P4S8_9ACTN|nr:GNAT family N-acetyltransferase [Streptomyces agglomeratus]OEJ24541.1 GNAT family N-acetyltransferase [Streptomyces agglomeratus]OEJ53997.1 GNAT family N-acetyltransferase [Streptomyces agglomeratus]